MIPLALLWRYFRTRKLHFTDREALENWQAKRLHQFRQNVLSHSPWFQRYLTLPFRVEFYSNWGQFNDMLRDYPLATPRTYVSIYE